MSGSHKKLPKLFWIQIILVVIIGSIYLLTPNPNQHTGAVTASNEDIIAVAKNLAPVGTVAVKAEKMVAGATRSGEEIYQATCQACHANGIANAPKLDDKAAWEPRVTNGLSGLLKTAINGKGLMPARGGDPDISDEEMQSIILYMMKKAGFDLTNSDELAVMSEKKKTVATISPAESTVTVADDSVGEKIYKSSCFACHDAGVAGSPKIGDVAAWTSRIAAGPEALYNSAINGKGTMPAKGGNMTISDADIKAAVDYMAAASK